MKAALLTTLGNAQSYTLINLLHQYGAVVLASDLQAIAVEGTAKRMNAVIQFPSEEAALKCYHDPVYQPLKELRWGVTENCSMVLVHGLDETSAAT